MTKRFTVRAVLHLLMVGFVTQLFAQSNQTRQILWTTDWSPNGKYAAVGGNTDTLKIYYAKHFTTFKSFAVQNTITRIKWHPSGTIMAVTTQMSEGKSFLLNVETNEKTELNGISPDGARGLDWNYTGEYLGVADNDGQILIFDTKGQLIRKFMNEPNSTKGITALAWHPHKNILATVSDKIRIFEMDGTLKKSIKHRKEDVLLLSIAWHKTGSFFVTGDYGDNKVKSLLQYWNEQGELIRTIDISKGEYRNVAWNRKGDRLASASDALRIWDTKGNLIAEGASKDYLWGVSWNEKGDKIITSSLEQRIILWNKKAKQLKSIE